MRATFAFLLLAIVLSLAPGTLRAHHSFAAEYDGKRPIQLQGVVTRIDWENPHVYVYIDVKDESGNVVSWALEGHPPNTLRRTGWVKGALKVGDAISVTGWRSKDDSIRMAGREVTLPDGKKLFLGPPAE
jgi:hypothetical protein